jgi:hypothetical protein
MVPFESFSIPRSENGLGLLIVHVLYQSEKAKFIRNLIRTPDALCRLTSLENIDSLHQHFRYTKNILDPSFTPISLQHSAWDKFSIFYQEGHEALRNLGWSIHTNGSSREVHDVSVQESLTPFLPATSSANYIAGPHGVGFYQMNQLLPALFEFSTPIITDGPPVTIVLG